jgi:autotransporter-associated beta strand protein
MELMMNNGVSKYGGIVLFALSGLSVCAATITWQAPVRMGSSGGTGEADVIALGGKVYAYTAGAVATVNSQAFSAGLAYALNNTDIQMAISSGTGGSSTTTFGTGVSGTQYYALSANYQNIVKGGTYTSGTPVPYFTVTLKRLTVNRRYLVQVWINDSRAGTTATRIADVAGGGGNTVTLRYNDTQAAGGVGYFAVGLFTADASTQAFTITGDVSSQLNAIQVRDLSSVVSWKGGSGNWDTSTENWQRAALCAWTNSNNDTAYFWDSPGTVSLTEGITIGGLSFNIAGYTLTGSTLTLGQDATVDMPVAGSVTNNSVIAGGFGITKTGQGRIVLGGADSYSGRTLVSGGTLALYGDGTIRTGIITNNATLELGHADAVKSSTLISGDKSVLRLSSSLATSFSVGTFPGLINNRTYYIQSNGSSGITNTLAKDVTVSITGQSQWSTFNLYGMNGSVLKLQKLTVPAYQGGETLSIDVAGNVFIENINGSGGTYGSSTRFLKVTGAGNLVVGNTGITSASSRSYIPYFECSGTITIQGPYPRNSNGTYAGYLKKGTLILKNADEASMQFEILGTSTTDATLDVQVNSAIVFPDLVQNKIMEWDGNLNFGSENTLNSLSLGNTVNGYTLGGSTHAERVITVNGKTSNLLIASGPITNGATTANLTKDGMGIFRMDKSNRYTGLTKVKAGTLRLNVVNAINPNSSGVQVDDGATVELQNYNQSFKMLSGEGSVTRGASILTITESVYPGGTNHIGTLTLPASTVLSENATIYIDAAPSSGSDTLVFAGNPPDLSAVNLAFTGNPSPIFADKNIAYLVMSCDTGSFAMSQLPKESLPAGWRLKVFNGSKVYAEHPKGTMIILF